MTKIVRITTYFLLICVTLSLSDWPYVDEILADLPAPQAAQLVSVNDPQMTDAHPSKSPIPSQQSKSCSCYAYGDLVNLAVFSHHMQAPFAAMSQVFPSARITAPSSAIPDRIDRPPRLSLIS